jgi:hypothetical protein
LKLWPSCPVRLTYATAHLDGSVHSRLAAIVARPECPSGLVDLCKRGREVFAVGTELFAHLQANPGAVQAEAIKALAVDPELGREYCYMGEQYGTLRREKKGRSYRLFLVG